jgi:hypothetical protein
MCERCGSYVNTWSDEEKEEIEERKKKKKLRTVRTRHSQFSLTHNVLCLRGLGDQDIS